MALLKVKELVSSNVLFSGGSQNNCPFCDHGKDFLTKLGVSFKLIELDKEVDVFAYFAVAMALHKQGKLLPLLTQAGAIVNSSA